MLEQFKKYAIIKDYILKKKEIKESNSTIINDESNPVNIKTLTNIGVFRVYAENYSFKSNINNDMTHMVRQLDPTSKGMPLEIYCFTYEKHGKNMKESLIFFHLLTIMSQFQLEIFEEPTGKDFEASGCLQELMSLICILNNVQFFFFIYIFIILKKTNYQRHIL
jgi:miniconductance mechanosensitive channel